MHYVYEQMINGKNIYLRELLYITKQTEALVSISCNSHKDREKNPVNFLDHINKEKKKKGKNPVYVQTLLQI